MTPADALRMHRKLINENGEDAYIRRYTGTGLARTFVDVASKAYVRNYSSKELIGSVIQGDSVAIMLVDSLSAILPITTSDKVIAESTEYSIKNPMRRVVGGTLIALEIHISGGVPTVLANTLLNRSGQTILDRFNVAILLRAA